MKGQVVRNKLAIYWDFENIHAALLENKMGPGAYRQSWGVPQEEIIQLDIIADYASTLGDISIHRAYANWASFYKYKFQLLRHSISLVQLFHRGASAKNGADIQIVLDAVEDIHHFPHITHVLIVGGDSDYVGLAQKLRQSGRFVAGIGIEDSTNPFWAKSCNEFRFYHTLAARVQATNDSDTAQNLGVRNDVEEFKRLLLRAMRAVPDQKTVLALLGSAFCSIDKIRHSIRQVMDSVR